MTEKLYLWFYDHLHWRYYDLLMKWCFFPLGGERRIRRELVKVADLKPGGRILDMCCGTGGTTFVIAEEVGEHSQIKAIDLSRGQIEVAKKKNRFPNIEFMVMDAAATRFSEGKFDRVVISYALHEMPRPTRLAVLKEARRVLVDGGTLTVLEMNNPSSWFWRLCVGFFWFYWLPFNFETPTRRDMFRHGLTEEIREAGFEAVGKILMCHGALQVVKAQVWQ